MAVGQDPGNWQAITGQADFNGGSAGFRYEWADICGTRTAL